MTTLDLARWAAARLLALRYRLDIRDRSHLPETGAVLLLSNHASWIDWLLIGVASPRPVRFVIDRGIYRRWYWRWLLDRVGVVPISRRRPRQALATIAERLESGEVVCLFPEGTITRTGALGEFRPGFERAARAVRRGVILPVAITGTWGSQFSRGRRLRVAGLLRRRAIGLRFGRPLGLDVTAAEVQERVVELLAGSEDSVERASHGACRSRPPGAFAA
ncbi:1-acyl-sn-glycerol-3-phosphate acyltransferase [Imhoffiella purpurea]|uniref:Phospholipid/glycerol acyltransferase domain-containing protein n=1 Tax=Imhoffiella purpurea TaxID=1249627 RepID=W9VIV5_9GAMM|nr:1-acyl-sn-glycerol-3-phosphate acyltransferase [Imhoffiella purpurea]EXJ16931.1 hypothetical protein D779_1754 [Imhoffiella purpurea]